MAKSQQAERGYNPVPYHQDSDESVTCDLCGRMDDADANYCDQCGNRLTPTAAYAPDSDETIRCPECECMNDDDAEYCDQCGIRLAGREDVIMVGAMASGVGMNSAHPRDNLVRARLGAGSVEVRADGFGKPTELVGYFSQFNQWYEIDSLWEGTFLERVAPGAFAQTLVEDRAGMKVLFDHGMDPSMGMKPLGPIRTLEERDEGPYYEVPLLDTDYNRDFLVPALAGRLMDGTSVGSQLGASFRFQVQEEQWRDQPDPSLANPRGLPERTITRARVFEFGPVTFPANPGASAGIRSLSDVFMARLRGDRRFLADFTARVGPKVARKVLDQMPEEEPRRVLPNRIDVLRRRARAIVVTGR